PTDVHRTWSKSRPPPIGGWRLRGETPPGSTDQGRRKPGDQLDEIGLASSAGFLEQAAEVELDRFIRDPGRLRDLGTATDLDDGKQDAQLAWRQLVGFRDYFGR